MRKANEPASLAELTGSGQGVSLDNLQDVIGEKMPEIKLDHVGRLRLILALQNRFGINYRSIPGVRDTLAEFDKRMKAHTVITMNQMR
jgi:hypothetical protein